MKNSKKRPIYQALRDINTCFISDYAKSRLNKKYLFLAISAEKGSFSIKKGKKLSFVR
jgi:hypothetical protein